MGITLHIKNEIDTFWQILIREVDQPNILQTVPTLVYQKYLESIITFSLFRGRRIVEQSKRPLQIHLILVLPKDRFLVTAKSFYVEKIEMEQRIKIKKGREDENFIYLRAG